MQMNVSNCFPGRSKMLSPCAGGRITFVVKEHIAARRACVRSGAFVFSYKRWFHVL